MSSNWVNALDACAAAGIIDYDAPAFLTGTKPRYAGHPELEKLPIKNDFLLLPGIKMNGIPAFDTYTNSEDKPMINNPTWKKILFGVIAAAGAVTAAIAIKTGKLKLPKIDIKLPSMKRIQVKIRQFARKIGIKKI